jgi:hypothetical protein
MSRLSLAVPVLALAVGLVGCTAAPVTDPGSEASSAPSTAPEEEAVAGGPECLVGDWYITQEEMQGFYDAVTAETGAGFTIDGGTGLTFTESTFTYTPQFTLLLDLAGTTGTGTIDGAISGNYSADDTTITTSQETSDAVLTVEIGGVVQDASALFGDILAASPINTAPYECTADGPLIQFDTGGGTRTPVQLTRP